MLIKYIREKADKGKGKPIGVIVALDKNKIGWSLCSKKDSWSKDLGIKIAKGRAEKGKEVYLQLEKMLVDGFANTYKTLKKDIEKMLEIVERYEIR